MKRLILVAIAFSVVLFGACAPASVSEPAIPAHFTTYTDEVGLFSISYPPDWEPALSEMQGLEQRVKEIIESIESGLPLERASAVFFAGVPTETGYMPNVNIVVESLPEPLPDGWTHEKMVEAAVRNLKEFFPDYHEFSRVKTNVVGRTATILEFEGTVSSLSNDKYHFLQMFIASFVSKTAWNVTCTAKQQTYSEWEDDFQTIVRSLRILK